MSASQKQAAVIASGAPDKTARIRELNDRLRKHLVGGRVMMTQGIAALGQDLIARLVQAGKDFEAFCGDNDPHGEHDFVHVEIDGHKVFFKIDYYDRSLEFGSTDPSDPMVTERVMTIMLAEEY